MIGAIVTGVAASIADLRDAPDIYVPSIQSGLHALAAGNHCALCLLVIEIKAPFDILPILTLMHFIFPFTNQNLLALTFARSLLSSSFEPVPVVSDDQQQHGMNSIP